MGRMIIVFIIVAMVGLSNSAVDERFRQCSSAYYDCGEIQGIGYPFWGGDRPPFCGKFEVKCNLTTKSSIVSFPDAVPGSLDPLLFGRFIILNVNTSANKMTVASNYLWDSICPKSRTSRVTWPTASGFNLLTTNKIISIFYGCSREALADTSYVDNVTCHGSTGEAFVLYAPTFTTYIRGCEMSLGVALLPQVYDRLLTWNRTSTLQQAVRQGLEMDYSGAVTSCFRCESSGGSCGADLGSNDFVCFCPDGPHLVLCPNPGMKRWLKPIIGASIGAMIILLTVTVLYFRRHSISSHKLITLLWKQTKDDQSLEDFISRYGPLPIKRYSYFHIRKMTNAFKEKLGQGGFGDVFKGKIDDHLVAVKILNKSKGDGEEFINEVVSISRTCHVNVVTLLGFCIDGRRRALVYEFMSNGSLDKFIYDAKGFETNVEHLGWEKLHQIAMGIAQGLEYLHRGCNTRILHLDIKPHNILLDQDFCPKISDFGLAKLSFHKESIVSMLGTRGTIGYIAPEVASRSFGKVSHKSDVFSYGMMILELVAGRKNVNNRESHTSRIYFPHWVYKRLVLNGDIDIRRVVTEDEKEMARKMVLVGLWCTQADPSQRPCIIKVIGMLKENASDDPENGIPPQPYLCASPMSEPNISAVSSYYNSPKTECWENDLHICSI